MSVTLHHFNFLSSLRLAVRLDTYEFFYFFPAPFLKMGSSGVESRLAFVCGAVGLVAAPWTPELRIKLSTQTSALPSPFSRKTREKCFWDDNIAICSRAHNLSYETWCGHPRFVLWYDTLVPALMSVSLLLFLTWKCFCRKQYLNRSQLCTTTLIFVI